ncbi:hypothetical protein LX99_00503 [Mucilaginibacter oryzae]|uniref:Uncharacterized protein n=1 Tax=Mucilaginibacter oryzae TaxID=468058 RepID=A0A316HFN8_9SPHI|nr:hypothetical protein [Mucilaginibacter oryzae]PWK80039.1 hypothetical protein LX99_00503 [Mucilaginibacter oryzae]
MKFFTLLAVTGGLYFNSLPVEKIGLSGSKRYSNKCCANVKKAKCPLAAKRAKYVKYNA